jgi:cephalosporin hydroxylase
MAMFSNGVGRRLRDRTPPAGRVADAFHRRWYDAGEAGGTWKATTFLGVPTWKLPLDLWVCQELVWELRPGLIVETGTAHGGSALYLAPCARPSGTARWSASTSATGPTGRPTPASPT